MKMPAKLLLVNLPCAWCLQGSQARPQVPCRGKGAGEGSSGTHLVPPRQSSLPAHHIMYAALGALRVCGYLPRWR